MKTNNFILIIVLLVGAKTWAQSELGTGDTQKNLNNFQALQQQRQAYTGDEFSKLPGIIRDFFDSSECEVNGGGSARLPNIEPELRAKATPQQNGGGLQCKLLQSGNESSESYQLCTAYGVTCKNSLGLVQKNNLTFLAPKGKSCDEVDGKTAFLNSLETMRVKGEIHVQ